MRTAVGLACLFIGYFMIGDQWTTPTIIAMTLLFTVGIWGLAPTIFGREESPRPQQWSEFQYNDGKSSKKGSLTFFD